jgi:hypothetical protein
MNKISKLAKFLNYSTDNKRVNVKDDSGHTKYLDKSFMSSSRKLEKTINRDGGEYWNLGVSD